MIVVDTGALIALSDADDRYHHDMVALFDEAGGDWVLPWSILPEVDYLLLQHVGTRAAAAFVRDLADGAYLVEWGEDRDFLRASELCERYATLKLGLVDATVIAVAERLRAPAIATVDLRDFGAIKIAGNPRLLPRDR